VDIMGFATRSYSLINQSESLGWDTPLDTPLEVWGLLRYLRSRDSCLSF